ncbi:potassium-transporting ATPase subunit KdpC [Nocardioides sp. 1609]|uniref:potassium-transporting ATPase subunit KdpC n=1 Tax=Nocardioides sp. 1609 TaxID=2508327 RepID=UPI00106F249D|nr:potassium-transporting ATPase subunit KdpC [Nocardioides sp. 1609]
MKDLYSLFRFSLAGLRLLVAMTLVLGLGYPLLVTGIARVAAPWQADGSLVTATGAHTTDPGEAVGSALLGQLVDDPTLFQPRPSAAGDGYDPLSSYGSNLGPESPELVAAIRERRAAIAEREGVPVGEVPPDAVTASGSGLDPHISQAYAALQVPRVAAAHDLSEDDVRALVEEHTEGRTLGILGEPRVNVLELNIAVTRAAAPAAG